MFSTDMKEQKEFEVKLDKISFETMEILMEYMYNASIHFTAENYQNVFMAADYLQMSAVIEEEYIAYHKVMKGLSVIVKRT